MLLKERIETIAHNVTLSRVTLGLVYFRSTVAGTIKTITIYRSTGGGIGGSWYFNVRKNGSAQFSGAGRPTFSLGVESVSKTGLSIAVAVGDVFELDLEQTGSGTILGHLVMSIEIETADDVLTSVPPLAIDDLSDVVITSPSVDDVIKYDGTNWVNDVGGGGGGGGISLYSPDVPYAAPSSQDDEFNAGSLDAKWTSLLSGGDAPTLNWGIPNHIGISPNVNKVALFHTPYAASGDFSFGAKLSVNAMDNYSTAQGGIFVYDESGWVGFGPLLANGDADKQIQVGTIGFGDYFSASSYHLIYTGGSYTIPLLRTGSLYLRCDYTHSSKSCRFRYSLDGVSWGGAGTTTNLTRATYASGAVTKIGFAINGDNSLTRNIGYFDWFRIMQGSCFGRNYTVS